MRHAPSSIAWLATLSNVNVHLKRLLPPKSQSSKHAGVTVAQAPHWLFPPPSYDWSHDSRVLTRVHECLIQVIRKDINIGRMPLESRLQGSGVFCNADVH